MHPPDQIHTNNNAARDIASSSRASSSNPLAVIVFVLFFSCHFSNEEECLWRNCRGFVGGSSRLSSG